ncbi:hypothetical protein PROSTU_03811 [Providencia stuartii ATCC 25827]|uniref:Uncharacterized protein n=1 Tax=Providencia stuartii ATCC 25827 TaxID=471874 RepID=A0AA86YFY3_PROST|nr:hypothetical protein PROSTU_03811 [Providencia stuartii ATCC 25827]
MMCGLLLETQTILAIVFCAFKATSIPISQIYSFQSTKTQNSCPETHP